MWLIMFALLTSICVCVLGDMVQKMVAFFAKKSFYDEELLHSKFKSYICERNGEYMHEGKKIEINERWQNGETIDFRWNRWR